MKKILLITLFFSAPAMSMDLIRNYFWPAKPLSALLHAIRNNNIGTVREALDSGTDANGREGTTPLVCATYQPNSAPFGRFDRRPIVELLLERGALVNQGDGQRTPLHMAIICYDRDMVELLLQKGADANARDTHGETPLLLILRFSHNPSRERDIIDLLLAHGADINVPVINAQLNAYNRNPNPYTGYTPLHIAVNDCNLPMAEYLTSHGADIYAKNNQNETPLDIARKKYEKNPERYKDFEETLVNAHAEYRRKTFQSRIKGIAL